MTEDEKIWKYVNENNKVLPQRLSQLLLSQKLNPKIISFLYWRGIDTQEKIEAFLNGGLECLHSPFILRQMQKATERIKKAIDLRELILVYGDRDVDGISAVNIIVDTVKKLGGNVGWYVPSDEGYGIHKDILSKYAGENVKVLITVDCGISAKEEIEYANTLGIDVILTDHHEPIEDNFPNPYALIDPKLHNTKYPFKDIAGCAVALKLAQAIVMSYGRQYNKYNLLFTLFDTDTFSGEFLWLCNDVEITRKNFLGIEELKQEVKAAYRIYTFSPQAKDALVKNDILLRDKIILFDKTSLANLSNLIATKLKQDYNEERLRDFFETNLDVCALGTIADSMPLIDENRVIVKLGLQIIASNPHCRPGLGLLIEDTLKTKDSYNITAQSIAWNVTPVLNSAGRMARGSLSAQLLITRDSFQAQNLYVDIIKLNDERKYLQLENIWQFKNLLKEQYNPDTDKVIIVKAQNLERGVTGIIATNIVKTYLKPAFLLISDGAQAIGAVRSVEGFNVIAALESVKDILTKYGGHNQAAGFTIENSKIDEFKIRILDYANKNLKIIETISAITIEGELKISDINLDFYNQIEGLAPFGMANPKPIFSISTVNVTEIYVFGIRKEHLKFKVSQKGSRNVQAVFWNKARLAETIKKEDFFDIAFQIDSADKNGEQIVQMSVIDIKTLF